LALTNKFGNLRKLFEFVVVEVQIITLRYIKLILSTPQNLIKIFALLCVCVCVCVDDDDDDANNVGKRKINKSSAKKSKKGKIRSCGGDINS
jgi:hypothetical protein